MTERVETYDDAIAFLYDRINYERAQASSLTERDFKLDRMQRLLDRLGHPELRVPCVHITGTKGKGSTATMLAAMLTAAGCRTGLYTSPHLQVFEERMTVDGRMPTHAELVALVREILPVVAELDAEPGQFGPTYFELATALAWLHFAKCGAEIVVLEVGLGGRLDSTNICRPAVCVLTNVSLDHTQLLGDTIAKIACEKAGIFKPGVPVITGATVEEAAREVRRIAAEQQAPVWWLGQEIVVAASSDMASNPRGIDVRTPLGEWSDLHVPLAGRHQWLNAALAIAVIDRLREQGWKLDEADVRRGLTQVRLPARIEQVGSLPTVILDAGHNEASIRALVETLQEEFPARRRILIFAGTRDKDIAAMMRLLVPEFDTLILTQYTSNPRAYPATQLASLIREREHREAQVAATPYEAWQLARSLADPADLICITGSFFIAAEMRGVVGSW